MEALVALSLACNVLQLVGTGLEAVKACKEIRDRGSLEANDKIGEFAKEISAANKDLQNELQHAKLSGRNARLKTIAEDTIRTSSELRIILNKIKLPSSAPGTLAFKSWIRTILKRGTIEKLQEDLEKQDRLLCSGLIKDI